MSNYPIVAGGGRRQREIYLDFNGSIGGPAARVTVLPETPEPPLPPPELHAAAPSTRESAPLVQKKINRIEDMDEYYCKQANWRAWCRVFLVAGAIIALIIPLIIVAVTLLDTRSAVNSASAALQPRVTLLMNSVDDAANTTNEMLDNVLGSTEDGSYLTSVTVPQLVSMVNSSSRTMSRLEKLLEHPQLQLALGGG